MDKGAHYFRCDFQVHSPRDTNWVGTDRVTDRDRREYAKELLCACRERNLHAIAITDHHDMLFASYVRDAANEETDHEGNPLSEGERFVVFPGMELTLGVPCQALLIFDADFPADLFQLAMTAIAISPNPEEEAKIRDVQRLSNIQTLEQLHRKLDEHTYLRDRYIVFPNVGNNGDFSLIRKGLAGKYTEMPCVGGYLDGDIGRLKQGTRTILDGRDIQWANKRVACFQTSDNRSEDHTKLGTSTTWVKWAVPTAEALRQACLAQESRVCQENPPMPAISIRSVAASNSQFLGPFHLELNPQYNCLIGGRGTGKSTILEYLRWALCDQPPMGIPEGDTPNYEVRRGRLIEHTLKPVGASVEIQFDVNQVAHTVRRVSDTGELLLKIADGEMGNCSEDDVRKLLPIQAYSQKQLSDVSVRVDELSRFIKAPITSELDELQRQLDEVGGRVRVLYGMVRRHRALNRRLGERALAERSLTEQADALRAGLSGLSKADREIIASGASYTATERAIESLRGEVRRLEEGATALRKNVTAALAEQNGGTRLPENGIVDRIFATYRAFLSGTQAALDTIVERAGHIIDPAEGVGDSPWKEWTRSLASFRQTYEAAIGRSSAHQARAEQLRAIEEQLHDHMSETARVRQLQVGLQHAEQDYHREREIWESLISRRDDLLDEQCARLTGDSDEAIRAHVKRFANPKEFVDGLRRAVTGSRVPGSRIEQIGQAVSSTEGADDAETIWKACLKELEALAEFDVERDGIDNRPLSRTLQKVGLTKSNLDGIGRGLGLDDWLTLSLTPIRSEPVFEYRAREQDYIPFRNASAGQQATALLTTLLNQSGPPLIIDQPEEDLDNPIILEIVKRVWEAKKKRQIIFASHNANLVVNGDAELVAWCNYRKSGDQSGGRVAGEGAIDIAETRDAIKKIMEGGEAAFNLRRAKYGF